MLSDDDIPPQVIKETTVTSKLKDGKEEKHLCMDVIWGSLSQSKSSNEILKFPHLSQVAKLVLTLPHSNADEERVFSLVRKNKTDFRASLDLNRTLSSVITVKMNLDESSHQFMPSKNLLKKAKAASWNYNQLHDGKSKKDNNTQQTTSFSASASTSIPTNSSAPTKSYSKNTAALKATCGNIASTAASTRGPVNSSNRTSNETIPIPKPSGAPAFAFTGHTFVEQEKKKPNFGKRKIDAAISVDQTDDAKRKKGGDPQVSNPANGVKGKTNNDSNKAKPGPTSHSTSSPSFSKKNEDRKDWNDKNNAPSFSKKDDKKKSKQM